MNKKLLLTLLAALCGHASAAATTYQLRVSSVGIRASTGVTPPPVVVPPVEVPKPSALTAVSTEFAFDDAQVGLDSWGRVAAFTNTGQVPVTLTGLSDFSAEFDGYSMGATSCEPGDVLEPGDTCTYSVTFIPAQVGPRSLALTLTSDGGSATIQLRGVGVAGPASLDLLSGNTGVLATVVEGATSGMGTHLYTFKNNSIKPLTASAVTVTTGRGTGGTISENTCTSTVAPGGTCSLKLTPTAAYPGDLTLSFAESVKQTTVSYVITAESTALSTSAPSYNGNKATWVLTNPNTIAPVNVTTVGLTGTGSVDRSSAFHVTGCVGTQLAPKQSCALTVEYLPASGLNEVIQVMLVAKSPTASGTTAYPASRMKWW